MRSHESCAFPSITLELQGCGRFPSLEGEEDQNTSPEGAWGVEGDPRPWNVLTDIGKGG